MKAIHQVGEMFGIPASATDEILRQVRENAAKLDGCAGPHDFSRALDRRTSQPLEKPVFGCRWQCVKCGGTVDAINRSWYNHGLKALEAERDKLKTALNDSTAMLRAYRHSMDSEKPFPAMDKLNAIIEANTLLL